MVGLNRYVTIATDISSDEKAKITTWACYIRYDGGVIKQAGEFNQYYYSTPTAETYALANALVIARKNVPNWKESRVIIHNEIEYVLRATRLKKGKLTERLINDDTERARAIREIALPILEEAQSYDVRNITAHFKKWKESDNPSKYFMNRWCDKASRDLMRYIRRTKKQQ